MIIIKPSPKKKKKKKSVLLKTEGQQKPKKNNGINQTFTPLDLGRCLLGSPFGKTF